MVKTDNKASKKLKSPKVYYNNEYKDISSMKDDDLVAFLGERFNKMRTAPIRVAQEEIRDLADKQWTALSGYDEFGNLKVSLPLEKNLEDVYAGRTSGKINFDIQPDGKQASVEELQPAQYAMEYYLEGGPNRGSGFYDIAPRLRRMKARYGTMFSFVGINHKQDIKYRIKKGVNITSIEDLENKENFEEYITDMYEFFPTELTAKEVYIDEKALGQQDIQKAEDIFVEKNMSLTEIKNKRGKNKNYDGIDELEADGESSDSKQNDDVHSDGEATIRFYYNNVTKDYIIWAKQSNTIIHKSKMLYNHGKMPIEVAQHYANINSIYGVGIPEKIRYIKGYKSEIMQAILDNAAMGTGLNFIVGNSGQVEQAELGGDNINIWQSTVGADQVQQFQPQGNAGLVAILDILDDMLVQDTGENVRASIEMSTDKVGIVEMMEENKAVRHKSVDEMWNLYLDRALTMMLSNLAQFAPQVGATVLKVKVGGDEIEKIQYPQIRVKDAIVKKKGDGIEVIKEDNYGKYGYFELKPALLGDNMGVKIVTPSSASILPLVKKANFSEWMDQKLKLMNMGTMDQSGAMMKEILESVNIDEAIEWMNDVYGFEDKLKADTGKDKIKKKNIQIVARLREKMEALQPTPNINGQTTGATGASTPQKAPSINEGKPIQNPATGGAEEIDGGGVENIEEEAPIN